MTLRNMPSIRKTHPVNTYAVVVIDAGVIGSSVAFHIAKLGATNVLVLDRGAGRRQAGPAARVPAAAAGPGHPA